MNLKRLRIKKKMKVMIKLKIRTFKSYRNKRIKMQTIKWNRRIKQIKKIINKY